MSLQVSWEQYNTLVERLALIVYESGFRFNQIICIARGGMRVGDVLSRIYEQPLAILSTHSYNAEGGTLRGELVIAEHMARGVREIVALPDPVGEVIDGSRLPNGLLMSSFSLSHHKKAMSRMLPHGRYCSKSIRKRWFAVATVPCSCRLAY